jgi:hypothetical protein
MPENLRQQIQTRGSVGAGDKLTLASTLTGGTF